MKRRGGVLLIGFAAAMCCAAHLAVAQPDPALFPPDLGTLESRLERIVEAEGVPGLAVAIMADGEIVAQAAAGIRRTGRPERVTVGDRFHIGSCTKAMTATLAAMLVEQERLSWDTTVGEALAGIRDEIHPGYLDATLRQLLAHRAGIRTDEEYVRPLWLRFRSMPAGDVDERLEAVKLALQAEPASKPGERFDYANVGYIVAAAMIEQETGNPWETLMHRWLFEPLGMSSAGFGPPGAPGEHDEPCGHVQMGDFYAPMDPGIAADNPAITGPAGNVHCTLADWALFAWMHGRGALGEQGLLLRPETFEVMHRPFPRRGASEGEGYALGWGVRRVAWHDGVVLQHAGSNTMWFAIVTVAPQRGVVIVSACNAGSGEARQACIAAADAAREMHLGPFEPHDGETDDPE